MLLVSDGSAEVDGEEGNVPLIVGGVCGGLVLSAAAIFGLVRISRKRKAQAFAKFSNNTQNVDIVPQVSNHVPEDAVMCKWSITEVEDVPLETSIAAVDPLTKSPFSPTNEVHLEMVESELATRSTSAFSDSLPETHSPAKSAPEDADFDNDVPRETRVSQLLLDTNDLEGPN